MSFWPLNPNNALRALAQPSFKDGVGRVRSKQPSSAVNAGLALRPDPAQSDGSVRLLSPTGAPPASTHGEFTVGSVSPTLKFSVSLVCCSVTPAFKLCTPLT